MAPLFKREKEEIWTGEFIQTEVADFHSHILPGVDDGSSSLEITGEMLDAEIEQKIGTVVATPHFYPKEESPVTFLKRREKAIETLKSAGRTAPTIYVGAEVAYFPGIGISEEMPSLCIRGTRTLLLEMPFRHWNDDTVREVVEMRDRKQLFVVLAHVERFLGYRNLRALEYFAQEGVFLQCNAEAFLDKRTQKDAMKLWECGMVALLGTDAHNLTHRKPNLGYALQKLGGGERLNQVERFGKMLLKGAIPL